MKNMQTQKYKEVKNKMWATGNLISTLEKFYQKANPQVREKMDKAYSVMKYDLSGMASGLLVGAGGSSVIIDDSTLVGSLIITGSTLLGGYVGSKVGKNLQSILYKPKEVLQ